MTIKDHDALKTVAPIVLAILFLAGFYVIHGVLDNDAKDGEHKEGYFVVPFMAALFGGGAIYFFIERCIPAQCPKCGGSTYYREIDRGDRDTLSIVYECAKCRYVVETGRHTNRGSGDS
jgi:hypothetical protein